MAPRLHDLREMDEWKRFANAAVQEELIAKAEALRAKYSLDGSTEVLPDGSSATKEAKPEDIEKAARELHEIQERWKQVAEAPRAQAQALWHRYRQAADPIQAKAREFFAQRAEERNANLRAQDGADRARRGARRLHRLDQDGRRAEEAAGRVAAGRPGPAPGHARSPGSASATRATASSPAATPTSPSARKPGRRTSRRRKRSAPAPRSWPPRASGTGRRPRSAGCRPTGRRSARCAAPSPRRSGSASAPPATPSSNATSAATRSSSKPSRPTAKALVVELEALAAPAVDAAAPAPDVPSDLLERVRSLRTRWNQTSSRWCGRAPIR